MWYAQINKFADMESGEFRFTDIAGMAENVGMTIEYFWVSVPWSSQKAKTSN